MAAGTPRPQDQGGIVLPMRPVSATSAAMSGPRLDLSTLELCYRYRQTYDDHLAGCVQDWEFDARAHLEDRDGSSAAERDDNETVLVGRGEALLVDLHAHRSPFDALDEHSEAAKEIAEVVLDPVTGELRRDFLDSLEGVGGHLLVLLDIHVEPACRDQNLGAIIGGFAVAALSPSAQAVVCRPEPHKLTDPDESGADPTQHRSAVSALHTMTAAALGFVPYRAGVFYLDTALVTFPEAFGALLRTSAAIPPA